MRIGIFGIGNVLAHDDAVGPSVARLLDATFSFGENVVVEDIGTPALEMPTHIAGYDKVILIDAVADEAPAGTVKLYRREDILRHPPGIRISPHDPGLKETLMMLDLVDQPIHDIVLVGIVASETSMGIGLSPEIAASFDAAMDAVLAELFLAGADVERRSEPRDADLWWAA